MVHFNRFATIWTVRGKMVPGKKNSRKNGPRKIVLQKLFSVNRMLGNLNLFIFIDWFHYTHKKMFDVHLTILHAPNCRTLKESRKVCCRVLGFHRLITSEHSRHTPRCSTLTPRFFFRVLGFHRLIPSQHSTPTHPHTHTHTHTHTPHDARRSPHDFLFLSFPENSFPGFI